MIVTNGKIYDRCTGCNKLVRLNKPSLGSLHFCEARNTEVEEGRRAVEAQKASIAYYESKEK